MSSELKPCPFCNSEVQIETYSIPVSYTDSQGKIFWRDEPDGFVIECKHHGWDENGVVAGDISLCSCDTSDDSRNDLIVAWNQRAERTCNDVSKSGVFFECSECGAIDVTGGTGNYTLEYCPECGAKVVE